MLLLIVHAKISNMSLFQLLKHEDWLLFLFEYLGLLVGQKKLKESLQNSKFQFCFVFYKINNHTTNQKINQPINSYQK